MLIADKVQGRREFIRHQRSKLSSSDDVDFYFDQWLHALDVGPAEYDELCAAIDLTRWKA